MSGKVLSAREETDCVCVCVCVRVCVLCTVYCVW